MTNHSNQFEKEIDIGELRKRKLFVATPMYGGQCTGQYMKSMLDLSNVCNQLGIQMQFFSIFNESLITRARNYCADQFMRSDYTHFMFIDADIEFDPKDVLLFLSEAEDGSDKDILCGPYPKKNISWEKVVAAVNKGFADENPNFLDRVVGDFVFNPVKSGAVPLNQPFEVMESGTGFMMIRRHVFEKMNEAYPHLRYRPDHVRNKDFDGTREIMAYFDTPICPETRRYLSEDYAFCQNARKIGLKVWLYPWLKINHYGTHRFTGDLVSIAQVGASATVDKESLKKIQV